MHHKKVYFKNIEFLANKLVEETNDIPHVKNPLSVAEISASKKPLVLDLSK